jgi:citrate synthase
MGLLAECLELARTASLSLEAAAERLVRQKRTAGERVPGFGHRVHSAVDPRVDVLFGLARDAGLDGDGIRCARAIEAALATVVRPIPLNIDGALAAVLYDLGFPPLVGTLLFIISRVAGLSAEVAEEYAREKPMRIRIPVVYDGPSAPSGSDPNGHD